MSAHVYDMSRILVHSYSLSVSHISEPILNTWDVGGLFSDALSVQVRVEVEN